MRFDSLYGMHNNRYEYFRKLVVVVVIGIILNALFYAIKPCKEAFAFGTVASALIWLILCLKDFPELEIRMNEAMYLATSISTFIVLGIFMESIIGFALYILTISLFARILLNDDLKYLINMALGTLKLRRR